MNNIDALVTAVMGYAFVFLGIVLLMIVMVITGKIMYKNAKKNADKPAADPAPAIERGKAPGTAALRHRSQNCRNHYGNSCRKDRQALKRTAL